LAALQITVTVLAKKAQHAFLFCSSNISQWR